MTLDDAVRRLAHILRAENNALALGDLAAAALLLPEKLQATAALQAAIPAAAIDKTVVAWLQDLATENRTRLALAIEVQGRILEMVAQAARRSVPAASRYGADGGAQAHKGALAMTIRA